MRNLITDVPGVLVGNDGVTVAVFEQSTVASVATLGGAPGSRATSLLKPEMTRGAIDAVVLSGGSLYGLDAAGGISAVLCTQGKGAQFGGLVLPVAVQAILFDLMNGGEKDWLREPVEKQPPYWELGATPHSQPRPSSRWARRVRATAPRRRPSRADWDRRAPARARVSWSARWPR